MAVLQSLTQGFSRFIRRPAKRPAPRSFLESNPAAYADWHQLVHSVSHDDLLNLTPKVQEAASVRQIPSDAFSFQETGSYGRVGKLPFASKNSSKSVIQISEKAYQNRELGLLTVCHELMHAFQNKHAGLGKKLEKNRANPYFQNIFNPSGGIHQSFVARVDALYAELNDLTREATGKLMGKLLHSNRSVNAMEMSQFRLKELEPQIVARLQRATPAELAKLKEAYTHEIQAYQASRLFIREQGVKLKPEDFAKDIAFELKYRKLLSLVEAAEACRRP